MDKTVDNSKPVGDLISRRELKKSFLSEFWARMEDDSVDVIAVVNSVIDNAESVDITNDCSLKEFGECSYNETGCSDCSVKANIREALKDRTNGDLISRSDLRKAVVEPLNRSTIHDFGEVVKLDDLLKIIDSAMSMEYTFLPQYKADLQCAYDCGFEQGKKEAKRPQGTWVDKEQTGRSGDGREFKYFLTVCSECGKSPDVLGNNFCPNCGADMRGGGQ